MEYKNTLIWQFVIAEQNEKENIVRELAKKHINTIHEYDFLEYELSELAKLILEHYDFDTFMNSLPQDIQSKVYESVLDYYIIKLSIRPN